MWLPLSQFVIGSWDPETGEGTAERLLKCKECGSIGFYFFSIEVPFGEETSEQMETAIDGSVPSVL